MSLNSYLNAFLALLEDRPEHARQLFGQLPHRVTAADLATIRGRIEQAKQNVRCQGVKEAFRLVCNESFKLEYTPPAVEELDPDIPLNGEDLRAAYLQGVSDVEAILAEAIRVCEETEKKLGPQGTRLP